MSFLRAFLRKSERLKEKISIDALFANSKSISNYPLKILYAENPLAEQQIKVMFVVPKKKVKRANKRNQIKRLLKEAYRINKNPLNKALNGINKNISIAIIYQASETIPLTEIEDKIILSLQRLHDKLSNKVTN